MASGPSRPRLELPTPLLTLLMPLVTLILYFLLPVPNELGRVFLALFVAFAVVLLVGFLVPAIYRRVNRGSLLVHSSASFFFGLISSFFLTLGSVLPWLLVWSILCLSWTFLPAPSFHRSLEDNFGDLFS